MLHLARSPRPPGGEEILDLEEGLGVDQRLVEALVLDAGKRTLLSDSPLPTIRRSRVGLCF